MAILTVQEISLDGLEVTYTAADVSGDEFPNDGRVSFEVKNNGASSITVTFNSVAPCNYGYDHDVEVTVGAGKTLRYGKFEPGRFNNANGRVEVSYSGVDSVEVAAIKM